MSARSSLMLVKPPLPAPGRRRSLRRVAGTMLLLYCAGGVLSLGYFTVRDLRAAGWAGWSAPQRVRAGLRALSWPVQGARWLAERGPERGDDPAFVSTADRGQPALKPTRYPQLLACMKQRGAMDVHFRTESGTVDILQARREGRKGLRVERNAYVRMDGAAGSSLSTLIEARVTLADRNGDGALDAVEIKARDWSGKREYTREIDEPHEGEFTPLWEDTLELVYQHGACFP